MNWKNLRRRKGGGIAAVYYVPEALREIVGQREIVRGLGTKDPQQAMRRKHAKLLEIHPGGERDVEIWFIGTQVDLREHWERVMDRNAAGTAE